MEIVRTSQFDDKWKCKFWLGNRNLGKCVDKGVLQGKQLCLWEISGCYALSFLFGSVWCLVYGLLLDHLLQHGLFGFDCTNSHLLFCCCLLLLCCSFVFTASCCSSSSCSLGASPFSLLELRVLLFCSVLGSVLVSFFDASMTDWHHMMHWAQTDRSDLVMQ